MRSKRYISLLAALLCSSATLAMEKPDEQAMREKVKQLGQQLQMTLKQAMQSGGPVAGIAACQHAAQPIAVSLSEDGWQVGRTALRVRNPANRADAWEQQQLHDFAAQLAKGVTPDRLEVMSWSEDGTEVRYMRPIMTAKGCLQCHGSDVNDEVKQAIINAYPTDEATGFAEGELRGAFTLTWTAQR